MSSLAFLLAFTLAATGLADTFVDVPGCYYFQGELREIRAKQIRVRIFGGAGAEEEIRIQLRQPASGLAEHGQVQLVAYVESKGALGDARLSADAKSVTPLPSAAIDPRRVGEWRGYPKKGRCQ